MTLNPSNLASPSTSTSLADLTVVLLVLGDVSQVEPNLLRTLESLQTQPDVAEVLCVLDGPVWETMPAIQMFQMKQQRLRSFQSDEPLDHPGRLANLIRSEIRSRYVTFLWPGTVFCSEVYAETCAGLARNSDAALAVTRLHIERVPDLGAWLPILHHGHIQLADIVSVYGLVVRTDKFQEIGGFDPNPALQRFPGWDLALRLAEQADVVYCSEAAQTLEARIASGAIAPIHWDWQDYPFIRTEPFGRDAAHRILLRKGRFRLQAHTGTRGGPIYQLNLRGLNPADVRRVAARCRPEDRLVLVNDAADNEGPRPYRITVTGGVWESVHNQLCFFNFFETSKGRSRFDWKTVYDGNASPEDLDGSDLVIISRGRCPNVLRLIDVCSQRGIPTLYMIDDNWFTIAKDWPVYSTLFAPGRPDYDTFIAALQRCTAVLVYNERMRSHVAPYARHVYRIDVNISLDHEAPPQPRDDGLFLIGYAGSPRYIDAPFTALCALANKADNVRVVLFSNEVPAHLASLANQGKIVQLPATSYRQYRSRIRSLAPDVLIAPLDDSETSRCKCINKFLEITAAGAAGVYSGMEPYTTVIRDGDTGILVPREHNDDEQAWYDAYHRLLGNAPLRSDLVGRAWNLIRNRYETPIVYPQFLGVIDELLSVRGRNLSVWRYLRSRPLIAPGSQQAVRAAGSAERRAAA